MPRGLAIALVMGAAAAGSLIVDAVHDDGGEPRAETTAPCLFAFLSRIEGDRHIERLADAAPRVSVVAPNWHELRGRGVSGSPSQDVMRIARRDRIAVWPVVNARLDWRRVPGRGAQRAIARLARRAGYSGITLDMEEVRPSQRRAFTGFVRGLARRLHRDGRRLAVYVPRRTARHVTRSAAAYDWRALSRAADLVLASVYNEHHAGGPPGPVTTRRGFRAVLRYAARSSRRRIAPTLGAFGYSWPPGGGRARLVPSFEAAALDPAGGGSFTRLGRRVFYETARDLSSDARAVKRARFRWVALFSLGREPEGALERMPVSGRCARAAGASAG